MPAAPATALDIEEFWEDLLTFIRKRRVIPVVGAELLTVVKDGREVPLYRLVAERLLSKHGLSVTPGEMAGHEVNEAVCALAASGRRIKDLYPRIYEILNETLTQYATAPGSLRDLAGIRDFDLFVTTTPDNLLVQAINAVRYNGADLCHEIEYAPNLPADRQSDIPEQPGNQYSAVFYLFGKADVAPFYAIHDEDALEFPYMLPSKGPECIFSHLRERNLLLIGCTFYDWLSRFFIRLSNSVRLSGDRVKREYLVGEETTGDKSLTVFLRRFSQDSRFYPGDARSFVAELCRRWQALPGNQPSAQPGVADAPRAGVLSGNIFLSYAHEDIVAARTLFNDLREIGGEVAWFDKSELKPGDIWDTQIRGAIEHCRLFLPLLSVATEQRDEGYFKREWKRAADRYEGIIGRKFIFPIVVDAEYGGDASSFMLVPDVFKSLQYGHAPAGRMSDALKSELTIQIRTLAKPRFS